MIRFQLSVEKLVNAIAFFAQAVPGSTKMQVCKLLYFADKEHLLRYGRPITGDSYYSLEHGPVPSVGLYMMRGKVGLRYAAAYQAKLRTKPNHVIETIASPDTKVFSRSDLRVLDETVKLYGHKSAKELRDLSHRDSSWRETRLAEPIPFELMFEGDAEAATVLGLISAPEEDANSGSVDPEAVA